MGEEAVVDGDEEEELEEGRVRIRECVLGWSEVALHRQVRAKEEREGWV